jgi:hypothetical protein
MLEGALAWEAMTVQRGVRERVRHPGGWFLNVAGNLAIVATADRRARRDAGRRSVGRVVVLPARLADDLARRSTSVQMSASCWRPHNAARRRRARPVAVRARVPAPRGPRSRGHLETTRRQALRSDHQRLSVEHVGLAGRTEASRTTGDLKTMATARPARRRRADDHDDPVGRICMRAPIASTVMSGCRGSEGYTVQGPSTGAGPAVSA